jgi:hypothetical protein
MWGNLMTNIFSNTSLVISLIGITISVFSLNIAIFNGLNKLSHPILTVFIFDTVLGIITGGLIGYFFDPIFGFISLMYCEFLFLLIFLSVKINDKAAIKFGEKIIVIFHKFDLQLCSIISNTHVLENNDDLIPQVRKSLECILYDLLMILGLNSNKHSTHICLLKVIENGSFKHLASIGVDASSIDKIEREFSHATSKIWGMAGYSVFIKKSVYINDLSDEKNEEVKYWKKTNHVDKKTGSIFCYPIKKGVGDKEEEIIAVISFSSDKKNAFDVAAANKVITVLATKIETLINYEDIFQRQKTRLVSQKIGG